MPELDGENHNTELKSDQSSLNTAEHSDLLQEQAEMLSALNASQAIRPLSYNPEATTFTVPEGAGHRRSPSFSISISSADCDHKRLIFRALNAAHYRYFMTKEFTDGRREKFGVCIRNFWNFLSTTEIDSKNRANVLKLFEAWRVKKHGTKTQSTGLAYLKLDIEAALAFGAFSETLLQSERDYLEVLAATKVAPSDPIDPVNLNHWFSQHTWLRREDVGIGDDLYTRLGSPKALIQSFKITVETALLSIQASKDALIEIFKQTGIAADNIPDLLSLTDKNTHKDETNAEKQIRILKTKHTFFNELAQRLATLPNLTAQHKTGLELFVFTHTSLKYSNDTLYKLLNNKAIPYHKIENYSSSDKRYSVHLFNIKAQTGLFDLNFIKDLARYAEQPENSAKPMPVCDAESLLFTWLMAYQTVQSSDIPKLTLADFRFSRQVNGKVAYMECEYFKGRANSLHRVKALSIKEDIGRAVLRYIKDVSAFSLKNKQLTKRFGPVKLGLQSPTGRLLRLLHESSLREKITKNLNSQGVTSVFLDASIALMENGVFKKSTFLDTQCDTKICVAFFGPSLIKTTAVYARSDNFDPTTLLNDRSHSDTTERTSYLTPHNLEWVNSCGRVTRTVMNDIAINLFRPSESDKQIFNSEFTNAIDCIKLRTEDTLGRMKVITKKVNGHVNEFGIVKTSSRIEGDLPDSIYVEDSPHTIMKLLHFLKQLEEKHHLLRECSPEFLFFTALPTAEWIEVLFDDKKFSIASIKEGKSLYEKYHNDLPPYFTAQLI